MGNEAIGRRAGGLSRKIHATCDGLGNLTGFHLTEGQVFDLEGQDNLIDKLSIGENVIADKAYDAKERFRNKLKEKGCKVIVPPKRNRLEEIDYDKDIYKERHLIENFFLKLKNYRGIATRYDKTAASFLGVIYIASKD